MMGYQGLAGVGFGSQGPARLWGWRSGWVEQELESHQEVAVQSAGSSTDGRATKVLWRMLMTGRALYTKHTDISASCLPQTRQRPGPGFRVQACVDLVPKVDRDGAPCIKSWRRERPLTTVALPHRSSTMRSDRDPTSRSG